MTYLENSNGEAIQIKKDIPLNKSSFSFKNNKIKGDYSFNFTVQNTAKIRAIIGYHGFNQLNRPTGIDISLKRNGNLLAEGFIIVTSDTNEELEMFFVGGNASWTSQFQNISIREYDWEDHRKEWYSGRILSDKGVLDGICFPLVDYMYNFKKAYADWITVIPVYDDSQDVAVSEILPAVYLHTVLQEIITKNGFKYSGNLFNDRVFNRAIITPDEYPIKRGYNFVNSRYFEATKSTTTAVTVGSTVKLPFDVVRMNGSKNSYSGTTSRYTVDTDFYLEIRYYILADVNQSYNLLVYKNGASYATLASYSSLAYSNLDAEAVTSIRVRKGDYIEIYINNNGASNANISASSVIRMAPSNNVKIDSTSQGDWVRPGDLLPNIKDVDFIKFVCNFLSVVTTYDQESKTINFDVLDNISSAPKDWSAYIKSHEVQVDKVTYNNFIKYDTSPDEILESYADNNLVAWGSGNIQVENRNTSKDNTLFDIPFIPARDWTSEMFYTSSSSANGTKAKYLHPYIPLITLDLAASIPFTASSLTGLTVSAWFELSDYSSGIIYVDDDSGYWTGFYVPTTTPLPGAAGDVSILRGLSHVVRSSGGTIYMCSVSGNKGCSSILMGLPGMGTIDITNKAFDNSTGRTFVFDDTTNIQTFFGAYFNKPRIGVGLDTHIQSMAIDSVNSADYRDQPISDRYYSVYRNIISNPPIKAKALLPESVFKKHQSNELVYLCLRDLNGIFYVDSIENYIDSATECDVFLNKAR